jgi:hypothetical protein
MHMPHALPRVDPVLNRYVERTGPENSLHASADKLDGPEEVGGLGGCEVAEAGDGAVGADEDVPREEGLEVYEGEGEGGEVEDLGVVSRYCEELVRQS